MTFAIALLRDDFTDNVINPAWVAYPFLSGSATRAETGGQAVITLPSSTAGAHTNGYYSAAAYDITGDGAYWNIATMVSTSVAASAYVGLMIDASNYLMWSQTSGTLKAQKVVAGVTTDLYSVAWNASTYKYLRIRESGGNVLFDSSTNGTSWTNRHTTTGLPIAVTALAVFFSASCGNVASPGTLKLDDFNLILPVPSSTWRETTADWSISNRLRSVTLAATSNAQGVVVTADTMDSSRVLGGTIRYFAGPLGSSSGGYLQLTEYASLVLAQASAFPVPTDGRVDLPAMVDARYMRLYHRSSDASAHTLREFVPRRLVQADDIEAESITAINISAGAVTADKIFVLQLSAITANIGGLNIDTTGYIWQGTGTAASPTTGLKIYNSGGIGKLSTYNTGVEQVTLDTDGKLKAGAGTVQLDASGATIEAAASASYAIVSAIKWYNTANTVEFGRIYGWYDNVSNFNHVNIEANRSGTTRPGEVNLFANGWNGGGSSAAIDIFGGTSAIVANIALTANRVDVSNTLNVGTGLNLGSATGAGTGQITTSGNVAVGAAISSAVRLFVKGVDSGTGNYAFNLQNSSATNLMIMRNDGQATISAAAWIYSSDKRRKHKIRPLTHGLADILALEPVSFDYIKGTTNEWGFIAQDVRPILPDLISEDADGYLGMKTTSLIPVLVRAVQELETRLQKAGF